MHNVPVSCMRENTLRFLGDQIGKVNEIDSGQSGECVGKIMRIISSINISEPLKKCIYLEQKPSNDTTIIPIQYEKLPEFCFHCGISGHSFRECGNLVLNDETEIGEKKFSFGAWMRAGNVERTHNHRGDNHKEIKGNTKATNMPANQTTSRKGENEGFKPIASIDTGKDQIGNSQSFNHIQEISSSS